MWRVSQKGLILGILALVLSSCTFGNSPIGESTILPTLASDTTQLADSLTAAKTQTALHLSPTLPSTVTPYSGLPLAQAAINLNIRSGPGTSYSIIGILPAGEVVEIIGQIGEPSWWQVRSARVPGGIGWIASVYTTTTGDVFDIPTVTAPPTLPPLDIEALTATITPEPTTTDIMLSAPDLVIVDVQHNPTALLVERPAELLVTIHNIGDSDAASSVLESAFLPRGNTVSAIVPSIASQGKVSVTLPLATYESPGSYTVVLTVDPDNVMVEQDETNNQYTLEVTFYRVVLHTSGVATVPGTKCFDLDGSEQTNCDEKADFVWEQFSATKRYLILHNGARAALMGTSSPGYEDCAAQKYADDRIDGSNNENNQITTGTYLCVETSEGHLASVHIEQYGYNLKISYTTWALADF